jgi:plexin A
VSCEPYRHLYLQTRKIVCRLDGPGINEPKAGPIIVKVADFRAESTNKYRFVDPKIDGIKPGSGPLAGGTRLIIMGSELDAGSLTQAFIENVPCQILTYVFASALHHAHFHRRFHIC